MPRFRVGGLKTKHFSASTYVKLDERGQNAPHNAEDGVKDALNIHQQPTDHRVKRSDQAAENNEQRLQDDQETVD